MKYVLAILMMAIAPYAQCTEVIDEDLITYQINEPVYTIASHRDQLEPNLAPAAYFSHFIRLFMMLFNNEKMQTNIKAIDEMLRNLIHTAFQLIKNNTLEHNSSPDELNTRLASMNPLIKRLMTEILTKKARAVHFRRAQNSPQQKPRPNQHTNDETTQRVLCNFALIAQNFFNIVQNPDNPDNVAPNLVGMLAGIVTIGTEVITRGLSLDADDQAIDNYVAHMDEATKADFYSVIIEEIQKNNHE